MHQGRLGRDVSPAADTGRWLPRRAAEAPTTKEVHYLDRWPLFPGSEQEYIDCFPAATRRGAVAAAMRQLRGDSSASTPHVHALSRGSGVASVAAARGVGVRVAGVRGVPAFARLIDSTDEVRLLDEAGRNATVRAADWLQHEVAFVDASPDYMTVPTVAPRVLQVAPHARFVIVLRVRCSCCHDVPAV